MFVSGEFNEEKIIGKIEANMESFKQLTVKFVQKGLEIKISKKELFENYQSIILKLSEILNDIKDKGKTQIIEAKTKTVNLYKEILNKIKEKEIEIKTDYLRAKRLQKAKLE